MSLIDIIKSISNPATPSELEQLKAYILSHPYELNQVDENKKTACHYALSNFPVLEILALAGKRAHLPENLTTDETLLKKINELKKEQMRIKKFLGFHLHDIIRRSYPIKNIDLHCRYHKDEINETSYLGRNACHWAAKMNRSDYLILFARLNGNLTARDSDGNTPFDLATTEETKNTIARLIDKSANTQDLSDKSPPLSPKRDSARNQDSSGVLTRIKSKVARALSPQREDITPRSAHEFLSLRSTDKKFEHHPRTKSPPISPREKAKPKQITTTKIQGILKTTRTTREKYNPRNTQIDINQLSNKIFLEQEMDNPITGSRTSYVPMPSMANNSNNDRLIPPQNLPSSTVKISATLTDSNSANTNSTGSIFVPMPRTDRDLLEIKLSPSESVQKINDQKQIRFAGFSNELSAEDIHNTTNKQHDDDQVNVNTKKSLEHSNEKSVGESDTSKYLQSSFFYSAEELITNFKSDNLEAFKQKKNNPNHKLSGFGRPYIIQAFLSNAGRIFIYLLQQGANLDSVTNSGKKLSDYISADNKEERIAFLKHVKEAISNKVSASRISNDQDRLDQLDKAFMIHLNNNGLNKPLKQQATLCGKDILINISKQHLISVELVQALYDLCLGSNNENENKRIELQEKTNSNYTIFNLDLIKRFTIFLLSKTEPQIIIAVLQDLFPHLLMQQQLITYFIIKEIILCDKFHHCYRNKQFCEVTLPTFIKKTIPPDKLDGYSLHLNEMIKLQNKINSPLIRASDQIDIIIEKFNDKNSNSSPNDFKLFADDLTNLVHRYFRTFKLNEWLNQAWSKENKHVIAPTLVEITSLFNKISDYVVISILESPNTKERFSTIEFYINTLNELINVQNRPCDLQSAMAISSALEKSIIKKYLKEFKTHNSKAFQLWENAQLLLDNKDYYKSHRNLMDNTSRMAYPFTGLFSTDLTLKAENTNLNTKSLSEASVFQKIIQLQNKALCIPTTNFNNNLLYALHNQKEMTNEDFELIEMKNNTMPISLDSTLTIPHLINLIDVYCTKKLVLKVTFIQNLTKKESEGLAALESVFTWIKEEIPVKKINKIEIDKLVKKMEQLPKTNKERIELHRTILMKWHALQLTKAHSANNQRSATGNNQEPIKKEKEHAEDDSCAQLRI